MTDPEVSTSSQTEQLTDLTQSSDKKLSLKAKVAAAFKKAKDALKKPSTSKIPTYAEVHAKWDAEDKAKLETEAQAATSSANATLEKSEEATPTANEPLQPKGRVALVPIEDLANQQRQALSDGDLDKANEIQQQINNHPDIGKLIDAQKAYEQKHQVTEDEEDSNQDELAETMEASRFEEARERLSRYNRSWKVNPSDIADFYLLEPLIHRAKEYSAEDTENMALLKARRRISEVGKKLSVAALRASLNEHKDWGSLKDNYSLGQARAAYGNICNSTDPKLMGRLVHKYLDAATQEFEAVLQEGTTDPDVFSNYYSTRELVEKQLAEYKRLRESISENPNMTNYEFPPEIGVNAVKYQLREYKELFDKIDYGEANVEDVLKDKQALLDTINILETDQAYNQWQTTAGYLKAYLFPDEPSKFAPENMDPNRRKTFLIDRLINQSHATGQLAEYISNDFPEMSLVLTIHGMGGDPWNVLWHHASPGLKGDLPTSSRSLLNKSGKQIPRDRGMAEEEKEALIEKMEKYGENARRYLGGIALAAEEPKIRQAALDQLGKTAVGQLTPEDIAQSLEPQLGQSIYYLSDHSPESKWQIFFPSR